MACENIGFFYEDQNLVLSDISFRTHPGEIVTIMGPSGSGKTTLLHIFNGILEPTQGKMTCHAKRRVTIFQDKRLIPWQTIGDNVQFGAKIMGIHLDDEQVDEALLNVGLSPHIKKAYPKILSGGMAQRVSVARAFACNPDMIFMDEPFSALDMDNKQDLMYRVADYIETKLATGILVTHDTYEAASLSHRVHDITGHPAHCHPVMTINSSSKDRSETTKMEIMETLHTKKE